MRRLGRKLVVTLLAALVAFFGAMAVASAAGVAAASSASAPNVAKPGTVAARDGAPFCDDRAASQPAAEPTPRTVDEGTLLVASKKGCTDDRLATGDARAPQQDDLQRTAPTARSVALMPLTDVLDPAVAAVHAFDRVALVGARDGFSHRDSPPPRPIPWAR